MKRRVLHGMVLALLVMGCSNNDTTKSFTKEEHWGYEGKHDPAHWNEISALCGNGNKQSPIDIVTGNVTKIAASHEIEFHESMHAELSHEVDNGHAIKIEPIGNEGVELNGQHYKLVQFHFHGLSEHTVDGKYYDMEMHLVHQNSKGELAVVGVFLKQGAHNKKLDAILSHLDGGDLNVTVDELLPKNREHFYHYTGSLTTPPCSENVKWYILKEPISIDVHQLAKFRSRHANNYRPIQPSNNRTVEYK